MKNLKLFAVAFIASMSVTTIVAQTKSIVVEKSKIHWIGKKVTGQHEGTINFKEGALVFKKDKLKGGNFVVDMTTISTTDLQGDYKNKLDGHLKNDDFFGADKFPSSKLVFKTIADKGNNTYAVTADLTIKGITNPVTFDMVVNGNTAKTNLKIDRTKYGIKYGSGSFFDNLGDKAIYDEFELNVNVMF